MLVHKLIGFDEIFQKTILIAFVVIFGLQEIFFSMKNHYFYCKTETAQSQAAKPIPIDLTSLYTTASTIITVIFQNREKNENRDAMHTIWRRSQVIVLVAYSDRP